MEKTVTIFVIVVALLLMVGSTAFATTWGSGRMASEKRELAEFHSVELAGMGNVYIQQGNEQSLEITTDDNLLKKLRTTVFNGKLKIEFEPYVSHVTRLEVHITVKNLDSVNISGSGNIQGKGIFKVTNFEAVIKGSGDINFEVEAVKINGGIYGSGDIRLKGKAAEEEIGINGSGDYYGFDLQVEKADVTVRGSGNCRINVTQQLKVGIYGSGDVDYKGQPRINSRVAGSGSINAED